MTPSRKGRCYLPCGSNLKNRAMKLAQEIRAGNVIMHGKDPMSFSRPNTHAAAAARPPCA